MIVKKREKQGERDWYEAEERKEEGREKIKKNYGQKYAPTCVQCTVCPVERPRYGDRECERIVNTTRIYAIMKV